MMYNSNENVKLVDIAGLHLAIPAAHKQVTEGTHLYPNERFLNRYLGTIMFVRLIDPDIEGNIVTKRSMLWNTRIIIEHHVTGLEEICVQATPYLPEFTMIQMVCKAKKAMKKCGIFQTP